MVNSIVCFQNIQSLYYNYWIQLIVNYYTKLYYFVFYLQLTGLQSLFIFMRYLLLPLIFAFVASNYFHYGTTLIPHPDKAHKGGQDAFLADPRLLVVADGVGGWNNMGIDPSAFSKTLCSNAHKVFQTNPQFYSNHPQQIMAESVKNNHQAGSATMTILTYDGNDVVNSANIGDSGYAWLRRNSNGNFALLYKSPEQQHSFNFPFQLMAPNSPHAEGDNPYLSLANRHVVEHGDYFVVGSDGLFDNIYIQDLLFIIKSNGQFSDSGQMINKDRVARILAQTAIKHGGDSRYVSPFATEARKAGYPDHVGGKLDDTTVIIAQIVRSTRKYNQQL